MKTIKNTDSDGASKNVRDINFWGDGDTFKLISKAWSEEEGWMKSTKAMEIPGVGCVVQVTTQQINDSGGYPLSKDGSGLWDLTKNAKQSVVAEAVTFVPGVHIKENRDGNQRVIDRSLVSNIV